MPSATPSTNHTNSIASSSQVSPATPFAQVVTKLLCVNPIANIIKKLNKGHCVVNRLYYLFVGRKMATSAGMGCIAIYNTINNIIDTSNNKFSLKIASTQWVQKG